MESLYLLIPLVLIFLALALKILFWAIKSGQYDDLSAEGQRILFDEDTTIDPEKSKKLKPRTADAAKSNRAAQSDREERSNQEAKR